jgi:DNA-binding CsgD family transcriptional regulator
MITVTVNVDDGKTSTVTTHTITMPEATRRVPAWLAALDFSLTPRELEVLKLTATGMLYKQGATHLGVNERTFRTHMNNIYSKTGIQSNTMLVSWAWLTGLLTEQDIVQAWRSIAPHLVELA